MIPAIVENAADWIAFAAICGAIATAVGAATARSLFATCMFAVTTSALAAIALLAFGAGDAALAQSLVGVGVFPFLFLAGLLLSARATRQRPGGRPWLTIAAAGGAAVLTFSVLPQIGAAGAEPVATAILTVAPWLAPLVLVAAAACVGLLGFGERGALERSAHEEPE